MSDAVSNPSHYRSSNGIEVIDVVDGFDLNANQAKAVEYILRADRKGEPIKDMKKAIAYLTREVEKREHLQKTGENLLPKGFGFPDYKAQHAALAVHVDSLSKTLIEAMRRIEFMCARDAQKVRRAKAKRSRRK